MAYIGRTRPPCAACHALGPFDHEGTSYELYCCLLRLHSIPIVDPEWPTVMACFGRGPEDFIDGIGLAARDPVLGQAKRRATELGLYDPAKPLSPLLEPFITAIADMIVEDLIRHPPPPEPPRTRKRPRVA